MCVVSARNELSVEMTEFLIVLSKRKNALGNLSFIQKCFQLSPEIINYLHGTGGQWPLPGSAIVVAIAAHTDA